VRLLLKATLTIASVAGALALPGSATAAPCPDENLPLTQANGTQVRTAMVCLANQERRSRGLRGLRIHDALASAVQAHSDDMAVRNYFGHRSPSGSTPASRVRNAGYPARFLRENIAGGYATARRTVHQWMESKGHCHGILSPYAREIGAGAAVGGPYRYSYTLSVGARSYRRRGSTRPARGCPYP
jgi:uncharacterized protein YkwD